MPRRKTPRPPEETRAIVRALRRRFISPEVEKAARAAFAKITAAHPDAARKPIAFDGDKSTKGIEEIDDPSTFLGMIRRREGITVGARGRDFSAEEQSQARSILEELRAAHAGTGAGEGEESRARAILEGLKKRLNGGKPN